MMRSRWSFSLALCLGVLIFSHAQAGWRDTGLIRARDVSSLVISIKKHKHDDGGDNGADHNHKKKKGNDQSDESAPESDEGSKDARTAPDSNMSSQEPSKTTTTPNSATTNPNVLWGDYFYVPPKQ
jgi:hypothetical protein